MTSSPGFSRLRRSLPAHVFALLVLHVRRHVAPHDVEEDEAALEGHHQQRHARSRFFE